MSLVKAGKKRPRNEIRHSPEELGGVKKKRKFSLKQRKKNKESRDRKLIEAHGGELIDLTDLTAWGEFETEYNEPKGRREYNRMLKKVKKDDCVSDYHENEDESKEEDARNVPIAPIDDDEEDTTEMTNETDADVFDSERDLVIANLTDEMDPQFLEENVQKQQKAKEEDVAQSPEKSSEEGETGSKESDDEEDFCCLMPFKGPLALRLGIKQKPSSLLDGVESSESRTDHMETELAKPGSERGEDEEEVDEEIFELSRAENKIIKKWKLFPIDERILKALAHMKYTEPTDIQSQCLMPALRDRLDILGAAETGSGKTLAFGIPLVQRLLESKVKDKLGALVLCPTRELAIQVKKHLADITKFTHLHVVSVVGGLCHEKQMRLIRKGPEIIVATPGRLYELLQEDPAFQEQLILIKCLVVDEADRMIQKGHFEEMQLIVKFMNANRTGKRQNLVFSATLTMDPHLPERVMEKTRQKLGRLDQLKATIGMTKPKIIDLSREMATAENLTEFRIFCEKPDQKDVLLYYFLRTHPGRTLVFCNSIDCVRRLKSVLEALRMGPMVLHAEMQQRQRLKHLDKFAASPNSLLLATDVAARGLDIKNIEHVIHFNVSKASETYVHRSGRTARQNTKGLSIMFVDGRELPHYRKLLHALKRIEDLPAFPVQENIMKTCKARVMKARQLEVLEHRQKKKSKSNCWFAKSAREADIELDDHMLKQDDWNDDRKNRVKIETLKKELEDLLSQRLIPASQRVSEALKISGSDLLKSVRSANGIVH